MEILKRIIGIFRITLYFLIYREYKKGMKLVAIEMWYKRFVLLLLDGDLRGAILAKEFTKAKIDLISNSQRVHFTKMAPILLCVIKDDISKMEIFFEHYRKLGVKNFVFLDNMSTDGTREFLCKQKDAVVYSCKDSYLSERRVAWINRMIVSCGTEKWYLVVDSDEFITYVGDRQHDLKELISLCREKGYQRLQGFMIDMYSDRSIFEANNHGDIRESLCYFDYDTYKLKKQQTSLLVKGGPRYRVFRKDMYLSKFPIFYMGKDTIVPNSHYMYPFDKNFNVPRCIGILHYKFVDKKDYEKVVAAVRDKNYSGGSIDYIQYLDIIKRKKNVYFYNIRHSKKFENSDDLKQIEIMEELKWEVSIDGIKHECRY